MDGSFKPVSTRWSYTQISYCMRSSAARVCKVVWTCLWEESLLVRAVAVLWPNLLLHCMHALTAVTLILPGLGIINMKVNILHPKMLSSGAFTFTGLKITGFDLTSGESQLLATPRWICVSHISEFIWTCSDEEL